MIGEAKKIENRKTANMLLDHNSIPNHKFYVDGANDEGVVFTKV